VGLLLTALLLVLGIGAAAARAGTLTTATWIQVAEGVPVTRTTTYPRSSGSGHSFLDGGVTSIWAFPSLPQLTTSFFIPAGTFPIARHVALSLGGGLQALALTATPSMAGATRAIPGSLVVMTALHRARVNASMYSVGRYTLLRVPLAVGHAGQVTGYFTVFGVQQYMTVDFYSWTVGTLTFTGLLSHGNALPDVVAMGAWDLSPVNPLSSQFGGAGTVTLVAPMKISIDSGASLLVRRTASFTTLTLSFVSDGPYDTVPVPEPGALLLIAAGFGALALRRRYGNTT